MYELVSSSQQPKAREFGKYCYNVMFPNIRQQVTDKIIEGKDTLNDELEERDREIVILEQANEDAQQEFTKTTYSALFKELYEKQWGSDDPEK